MERLEAEEQLMISEVEKSLRELESIEENYKQLLERLENLPKKLRHPVTVPLNSVGFFQGELIHTNEITVLLSREYFVEVSASKASEITERRIEECRNRQRQAKKQMKNLTEWRNVTHLRIEEDLGGLEINEEFDEAKEAKWREEHAKRVREERKREREAAKSHPKDDREWLEKLEELEMLDELEEYSTANAPPSTSAGALLPAVDSLKLGEPSTSGEDTNQPRTSFSEDEVAKKWNPSTGSFESIQPKREKVEVKETSHEFIDSDDSEEPEVESDDPAEEDAFTGLLVERDPSGNVVTCVGEAPVRQSRFKASRR